MYFCLQIPNMKVINIRLETADIWSKLTAHKENFFLKLLWNKQLLSLRAFELQSL